MIVRKPKRKNNKNQSRWKQAIKQITKIRSRKLCNQKNEFIRKATSPTPTNEKSKLINITLVVLEEGGESGHMTMSKGDGKIREATGPKPRGHIEQRS